MIARCESCSRLFVVEDFGRQRCPHCRAEVVIQDPTANPPPAAEQVQVEDESPPTAERFEEEAPAPIVPWEDKRRGFLWRFLNTCWQAALHPRYFFAEQPTDASRGVFSFGWLCLTLGGGLATLWNLLSFVFYGDEMMEKLKLQNPAFTQLGLFDSGVMIKMHWWALILSPLLALITIYAVAGLYHLGLLVFGGRNRGYDTTFRVTTYGFAPALLFAIPSCGAYLGMIWSVIIHAIGLSSAHRIGQGRAVLVVVIQMILFCCLATLFIGVLLQGMMPGLRSD